MFGLYGLKFFGSLGFPESMSMTTVDLWSTVAAVEPDDALLASPAKTPLITTASNAATATAPNRGRIFMLSALPLWEMIEGLPRTIVLRLFESRRLHSAFQRVGR